MRHPSSRCLSNSVDLYRFVEAFDHDMGLDGTSDYYPTAFATSVGCSVQLQQSYQSMVGNRPSRVNEYYVMFGADYALGLKDLIRWVDGGVTHDIIVDGQLNAAGKNSNWAVTGTEVL